MFYDMPSYDFEVMSTLSWATNSGPLSAANPCPIGHNCTYTISFDGPAYKCEDMADFDGTTEQTLKNFAPTGQVIYSGSQIIAPGKLDAYGIPAEWFNVTDVNKYGFFTKEYPIWIGYLVNTTKPNDGVNKTLWPYELDPKVIKCTMNNAKYDVTMSFINGQQAIDDTQVQYNGPILPSGQSVAPTDPIYKQFSTYHALSFRFQDLLSNNNYQPSASSYAWPVSEIAETTLVDRKTLFAVDDFPRAVERKFSNLILSILSRPQLLPYFNVSTPCTIQSAVQVWDYRPFWLIMSYAIGSGVTLLVIAVGIYALLDNGYGMDTSFSTMLAVSRNGELDSLMEGCSLGRTPLPERILKTRLQFGEAIRDAPPQTTSPVKHAAFGFETTVRSIEVGGEYH
ncbi:hypothetical protein GQ53DRAFT_120833 [Thozetella sp. PMI_491]|nr:hypothetical protein GQ53DRAFT_120833 [Thozetella sp. PMI_491]